MENKNCKQCSKEFIVEDEDLEFYKKISPVFAGKTYQIPPPDLCPECREITRLLWRNERSLYKRKSDKSGDEIVSVFSPDKKEVTVFSPTEWWSDDWSPMDHGKEFDDSRPFFQQFDELRKSVPLPSLVNLKNEDCEFANYIMECKNCYMSVVCYYGTENTHYSYAAYRNKDCIDVVFCDRSEKCYNIISSNSCYGCANSIRLENCRDCKYCIDLTGCSDCLLCSNLSRKQFCIKNKQYTEAEYREKIAEYDFGSHQKNKEYEKEFEQLRIGSPVKFARMINCEDCTGNNHLNCKDVKKCFNHTECENTRYSFREKGIKDSQDCMGGNVSSSYYSVTLGYGTGYLFCVDIEYSSNMMYSLNCYHCKDCFGCVGLRNKQYCILNKQYDKETYEKTVATIIERMIERGEWGKFFPIEIAPFAYNETLANNYMPFDKERASSLGAKWKEYESSFGTVSEYYVPEDNIAEYANDERKRGELLAGIIKCEKTEKPFKIFAQELAFYIDRNLPIPRIHYDERHKTAFGEIGGHTLFSRQCDCEKSEHGHSGRCENKFETIYSTDSPYRVYCEDCYQKSIL